MRCPQFNGRHEPENFHRHGQRRDEFQNRPPSTKTARAVSTKLHQHPTNSQKGPAAVVANWVLAITEFLALNNLAWSQVEGVGLAIPGPYERYGVLGNPANLSASFAGWNVLADYQRGAREGGRAGR